VLTLTKLQLFVSLLTITLGYPGALKVLLIWDAITLVLEFWWIQVVYNCFPALHTKKQEQQRDQEAVQDNTHTADIAKGTYLGDWAVFAAMPIFYGAFCIVAATSR